MIKRLAGYPAVLSILPDSWQVESGIRPYTGFQKRLDYPASRISGASLAPRTFEMFFFSIEYAVLRVRIRIRNFFLDPNPNKNSDSDLERDFGSCQRNSCGLERSHLGLKLNKNKFEWLLINYMNAAKLPTLTFPSHRA
jgi:hypothetical protein